MKKIFLLLILVLGFTLTGCKSKGFDDPEDAVQAFFNLYTDAAEGKNVDIEEECASFSEDDFLDSCIEWIENVIDEVNEYGEVYSWSYTITDSEERELSETEKVYLELEDYDKVIVLFVQYREEFILEEGDTMDTDNSSEEFYLVLEDGNYYIILIG